MELQTKLLRVLQEREFQRLGSSETIKVDVRVIAATNCDLLERIEEGRFREDLYYRLNVFPLTTAPLRERRDDVLPLAMHVLNARCRPGERIPALSAEAAHILLTHTWPGNVRELDNVMQRALILGNGPVIQAESIQIEDYASDAGSQPAALPESLSAAERELILDALRSDNGNRQAMAKRLGISPRTLRYKLAKLRDAGVEV
jgi:two-component system response regulator FlrC